MTFNVLIEAEAKLDWQEAVDWYDAHKPGVGQRFNHELRVFLRTLVRDPERFRLVTCLTRKAKVPKPWPYSVYFTTDSQHREVRVLAIWHGKRSPRRLRRRIE